MRLSMSHLPAGALLKTSTTLIPSFSSLAAALVLALSASGCANRVSTVSQSEGHLTPAQKPAGEVPAPVKTTSFAVPPPKPAVKEPTYSVVVNDVPVKELLQALARDTKQNIDIHPAISGVASINAINETLPAILDRVSRQVGIRYRKEGQLFIIEPDAPFSKTYRVDYVNMTRNTSSVIGVSGQIAAGTTGQGGQSGTSGSAQSVSTSAVTTTTINEFWKALEASVRAILSSSQNQALSAQAKADRIALFEMEQRIRLQEAIADGARSNRLTATGPGGQREAPRNGNVAKDVSQTVGNLFVDDVIVNAIAGTVTVTGTESQHRLVSEYLSQVQKSAQRQVLIEATIVEITLSDAYQAGIDWSRLQRSAGGGITFQQNLLNGALGTPPNFTIGYTNPVSRVGNIAASIRLLEQFGSTRVLSSPKVMALNNQTALLKVVDNIVYFDVSASTSVSGQTGATFTSFNTKANTVAIGVVMTLTPQISESNQVNLTVRPTISRVLSFVNDPNPELARAGVVSRVPQVQTREMESVLQVGTGQTVILGGLMQDNTRRNRDQIPGADNLGGLGELFRFRDEENTKTELVVFLRPTVVANPTLDSDELNFFQRFLPQASEKPGTAK